jgi:hypothetical protein
MSTETQTRAELVPNLSCADVLRAIPGDLERGFIPPLENGDRLTAEEFERRYAAMPELKADDYAVGAPELVVEVAASSVSYDLHGKLQTYRRNGVRESIVWRVQQSAVDWFVLEGEQHVPLAPGDDVNYRSRILPGPWLDPSALVRRDNADLLQVVHRGLVSEEHTQFVARLQDQAARLTPPAPETRGDRP